MAPKKGKMDSIKAAIDGLASRVPFHIKTPPSPEPFSAIEDDTPLGDLLSASNAAPGMAAKKTDNERPALRAIVGSALGSAAKSTPILVGIIVVIVFLVALAITAIIVASPPKSLPAAPPFTEKGEALVKTWFPPPGDPLEPRMAMEREGAAKYGPQDAARLGIDPDPRIADALRVKNDEAIDDLYGTVP
jgi:hypothetical protein